LNKRDEVNKLLAERGAVLARKRKHEIWKFPDGRTFVRASTTSDRNSEENNLSDLRKLLGIQPEHKEGVRRAKKNGNGATPAKYYEKTVNTGLADQLQLTGVVLSLSHDKIDYLTTQNELLAAACEPCWFCRLKEWWRVNVKREI
jgi:hypothetical protein